MLALFSMVYFYFSFAITTFKGSGATPLDSRFMPQFWGISLFILSILLILRAFREKKIVSKEMDNQVKYKFSIKNIFYNNYEVILTFLLIAMYILFLKTIGFIVMSIGYIFLQVLILTSSKKKNYMAISIMAVFFAVGLDFLFVRNLHVLLPKGILGF